MPAYMLLEVLYRVRAAPREHLGRCSLARLQAFHLGYSFFPFTKAKDYRFESVFRDWVIKLYQPFFVEEKDSTLIVLDIALI